jgi:antitoxin component YwqK of YwqJK toxin-antitoxin module
MKTYKVKVDDGGNKFWYLNGKCHREDGPAIEYADGNKYWYLNGVELSEEEFKKRTAKEVVLTLDEIAAKFGIEVSKLKIAK